VRADVVYLNSLGDRETAVKFLRELTLYYRRYGEALAPCCRSRAAGDILALARCDNERCAEVRRDAPRTLSYLHETHRQHLKDVLEYIEGMDVPYSIDEWLIDTSVTYAASVFELRSRGVDEGARQETHGFGGRYEGLARRAGIRGAASGVSLTLSLSSGSRGTSAAHEHATLRPRVLFIQLGFEALRRGLVVLELMRRARIPVLQALGAHTLAEQVSRAERESIPYTVIIGHREALDGTAIVRNTATRSQETIPVALLPRYFKSVARVH
jgi:histidyl-tRNA synthetase